MIALILGGAPSVWHELSEASGLIWPRRHIVVAANLAGIALGDRIDGWATEHADELPGWMARRQGNDDYRTFTPADVTPRWDGSSGLFALQCALFEMGASAAILCGVPMDSGAGHFSVPGPWALTTNYRRAFQAALPEIGGRVRSMSGWTADLLGAPTATWVDAVATLRPLGASRPQHARTPMHKVENTSKVAQKIIVQSETGGFKHVWLAPGESDSFEIDPKQARYQTGDLKVTALADEAADEPKGRAAKAAAPPPGHKPINPDTDGQ